MRPTRGVPRPRPGARDGRFEAVEGAGLGRARALRRGGGRLRFTNCRVVSAGVPVVAALLVTAAAAAGAAAPVPQIVRIIRRRDAARNIRGHGIARLAARGGGRVAPAAFPCVGRASARRVPAGVVLAAIDARPWRIAGATAAALARRGAPVRAYRRRSCSGAGGRGPPAAPSTARGGRVAGRDPAKGRPVSRVVVRRDFAGSASWQGPSPLLPPGLGSMGRAKSRTPPLRDAPSGYGRAGPLYFVVSYSTAPVECRRKKAQAVIRSLDGFVDQWAAETARATLASLLATRCAAPPLRVLLRALTGDGENVTRRGRRRTTGRQHRDDADVAELLGRKAGGVAARLKKLEDRRRRRRLFGERKRRDDRRRRLPRAGRRRPAAPVPN